MCVQFVGELTAVERSAVWIGFSLALIALAMASLLLGLLRANTNSSAIYTHQALCLLVAETLYVIALQARPSDVTQEVGHTVQCLCVPEVEIYIFLVIDLLYFTLCT